MSDDRKIKVLWVHNFTVGIGGTFMRDIQAANGWQDNFTIQEFHVPVSLGIRDIPSMIRSLRIRAKQYDIVHAQFGSLCGFIASFSGRPLITSIRGSDFYLVPSSNFFQLLRNRLRQLLTFWALVRSQKIISMSWGSRDRILSLPFMRKKQVEVIVDPAGLEFWPAIPSETSTPKLKVFVGSLRDHNPIKRQDLAEKAVSLCNRIGLDIELITVTGRPRSEVRTEMAKCDLVLLTSIYEGWPNVIKEGLLLGLPFVATDVSDLKDFSCKDVRCQVVNDSALAVACALANSFFVRKLALEGRSVSYVGFWPEAAARKIQLAYVDLIGA